LFASASASRQTSISKQEIKPRNEETKAKNTSLDDSIVQFARDLDKSPKKISFIDKYSPKKGKRKEF
jgi:hypothetical protein